MKLNKHRYVTQNIFDNFMLLGSNSKHRSIQFPTYVSRKKIEDNSLIGKRWSQALCVKVIMNFQKNFQNCFCLALPDEFPLNIRIFKFDVKQRFLCSHIISLEAQGSK